MAKKPNTQESLSLAFEILKRIPRSRYITTKELNEQLEELGIIRNIRSIQRAMETLCDHFDIIRDERSKPYGYKWGRNHNGISLHSLSPHESLLLNLAEDYLSNLLPATVMSSLDGFFSEASYNLNPTSGNEKERAWMKKVRVVSENQPVIAPDINMVAFKHISEALFNDRLLTIEYVNGRNESKKATVMPLGLAQQGVRLYLVCRFEGYDNERSIAVHRVSKATVSTFEFIRPLSFNLRKYDADGRFGFGEGEHCNIQFSIEKNAGYHLLETPLSESQKVEEFETHYQISAEVIDSLQLEKWVRGFGEDIFDFEKTSLKKVIE